MSVGVGMGRGRFRAMRSGAGLRICGGGGREGGRGRLKVYF